MSDDPADPHEPELLHRLYPDPTTLPLDELYEGLTLPTPKDPRRAWIAVCMVSSLDGAVAVDGRSGGLGGVADLTALSRLRGANDVSLVGAATVRTERYGPLTGSSWRRGDRRARGLRPSPRLAIVTASGDLDARLPVFGVPGQAPIVLAGEGASRQRLRAIEDRAEIHRLRATGGIDAREVVEVLVGLGLRRVLLEGGPTLNAAMLEAGMVDELFVTIAPSAVGGPSPRIVQGVDEAVTPLTLVSAFTHGGDLLLRHRRVPTTVAARGPRETSAPGADQKVRDAGGSSHFSVGSEVS